MKPILLIGALGFAAIRLCAQSTPQELADTILRRWTDGSPADFAAVYPLRDGRGLHANAVREKVERTRGLSQVIRTTPGRAVLLLSGVCLTGNSGDDTIYGMDFSGMYEALSEGERWRIDHRISITDAGQIDQQRLKVSVRPGQGVDVEDRLQVRVKTANGFFARLNHRARLESVRSGAHEVSHQFDGGLLWADLPHGEAELTLRYSLEVESAPKDPNSGRFTTEYGHIRNQYLWHPAFDFTGGDEADFQIEARIPGEFRLTTSLPQTEQIDGRERIINAKSVQKASTLTLAYDRGWKVLNEAMGKVHLDLFVTPTFRPDPAATVAESRRVYALLASRFGTPSGGYMAIVEARADPSNQWRFNSNQAVFAMGSPGSFSVKEGFPSAKLGHEIGHFWTSGAGPAANFLREGWATYTESLALEDEFGPETTKLFWEQHAKTYFKFYDGKAVMWGSDNGSNLNYDKGGWVFRMLQEAVGTEAFQKGMTEFSRRSLAGEAGWEILAECFQQQNVPDFNAQQFLLPWLKEKQAPHLTLTTDGRTLTIEQAGPVFALPLTVEGVTAQGTERHRIWIRGPKAQVEFSGTVSQVRIDPDKELLLPQ